MSLLPVKGDLDGSTAGHNQGMFKTAIGNLRDFLADLFGTNSLTRDAVADALKFYQQGQVYNAALTFSVATNALTISVVGRNGSAPSTSNPILAMMRAATASAGDFVARKAEATLSLVISSGSTLGHFSGEPGLIFYYLISNAGTLELAASSTYFGPQGIVTTTAEGGAGAADSASTMYSATARTNVPFVCIGRSTDTQATAGTWTSLPSSVELAPFETISLVSTALPQNSQSADYTVKLSDASKHLFHPASDANPRTFTIPANSAVPFPIGTSLTFINRSTSSLSIAITTDTLVLAGAGTTGTRVLQANSLATAIKIGTTEWIISGVGLI